MIYEDQILIINNDMITLNTGQVERKGKRKKGVMYTLPGLGLEKGALG